MNYSAIPGTKDISPSQKTSKDLEEYKSSSPEKKNKKMEAISPLLESKNDEPKNKSSLFELKNEDLKKKYLLLENENEKLKSNLDKQKLLVAGVSHDIRNHLNIILFYTENLSNEIEDPEQKIQLDVCNIRADIIANFTDHFLDGEKFKTRQLESSMLNFGELMRRIWKVSSIEIQAKRLQGNLDFSKEFPQQLKLNKTAITRILLNLIGNAIKFTNTGSIKVSVSWHDHRNFDQLKRKIPVSSPLIPQRQVKSEGYCDGPTQLVLSSHYHSLFDVSMSNSFEKREGALKIEVIDTGCGISSSDFEKIFERGIQTDSSVQGYGLGLHISKQLVKQIGGDIDVESTEGHGTKFCVVVPVDGYFKRVSHGQSDKTSKVKTN